MSSFRRRVLIPPSRGSAPQEDEPEPILSMDSSVGASVGAPSLSTPFSQDIMDQILSPTMEDDDNNHDNDEPPISPSQFLDSIQHSYSLGASYSAVGTTFSADDSIIQRVEQEIAAARKAAAATSSSATSPTNQNSTAIVANSTVDEISMAYSSFDNVLHLIDDEFDDDAKAEVVKQQQAKEPTLSKIDATTQALLQQGIKDGPEKDDDTDHLESYAQQVGADFSKDSLTQLEENIEARFADLILESRDSASEGNGAEGDSVDSETQVVSNEKNPTEGNVGTKQQDTIQNDCIQSALENVEVTAVQAVDSHSTPNSQERNVVDEQPQTNQDEKTLEESGEKSGILEPQIPEVDTTNLAPPRDETMDPSPTASSIADSVKVIENETPMSLDEGVEMDASFPPEADIPNDMDEPTHAENTVNDMDKDEVAAEGPELALCDELENVEVELQRNQQPLSEKEESDSGVEIELEASTFGGAVDQASDAHSSGAVSDTRTDSHEPPQSEPKETGNLVCVESRSKGEESEASSVDPPGSHLSQSGSIEAPVTSPLTKETTAPSKDSQTGDALLTKAAVRAEEKATSSLLPVSFEEKKTDEPSGTQPLKPELTPDTVSAQGSGSISHQPVEPSINPAPVSPTRSDVRMEEKLCKSPPLSPTVSSPGRRGTEDKCRSPPLSPEQSSARAKKFSARRRLDSTIRSTKKTEENQEEVGSLKYPKKIRFRKPFPVLKPAPGPRSSEEMIKDHSIGLPDKPIHWMKPKKELKQLIVAAMGTSLQRRSNACGALKVLTSQKKNQISLVRTDSFLTALVFTASQNIAQGEMDLALDARTRAVACLRNVSTPKENREHVFSHPGLVECLLKVVEEDIGEGRAVACAALALLAKSPSCREGLVCETSLLRILSRILIGPPSVPGEDDGPVAKDDTPTDDGSISEMSHYTRGSQSTRSHSGSESDSEAEDSLSSQSSSDSGSEPPVAQLGPPEIERVNSIRNRKENMHNQFHGQARSNACAVLVHLSRSCAVSPQLAKSDVLVQSCVSVAMETSNPIHTKCIEILRNLTLFPANNTIMTRADGVVLTFVAAAESIHPENRLSALRALQNMSADASSKAHLASKTVLNLMTSCAMRKDQGEKEAAVATLYNITTEPSTVVAITNTKNVIATLVHLAHNPESSAEIRLLACEALATTSLWLQTLAGTGIVPDGFPNVPLPSQKTYGWERWD